ncbi:MAG: ABC transporter ATP-binding protein [Gammaproteobacteria bacterium]|nr:ABC transporter ATP-binding protein [Gammaproteobacteria bacterium]MCW8923607.1 ABC transporter ATP-binding protein [Gammaproteobacteria bacterium]
MPVNALSIKNLKKTYRNGTEALLGVDLDVKEGDFFALLGPNGAGKSTTIGIISSLVNKTSGNVSVFGHDIETDSTTARSLIGLVPQEFNFNIFVPIGEILINQAGYYGINRNEATKRAEKYLRKLELWDKRFEMAKELSGGMKRRLMIARALVHEPRLLILDEPTAGVDIEVRHSMWAFMREINAEGTTIILTTHYLEEAENLCNHIAIIDKGVTIEHTSMRKLLDRLDMETFVLYLEEGINELPECSNYQLRLIDSNTIEADIAQSQSMNELYQLLSACNIKVLSMRNKTNRLEQLFVSMMRDGNTDNYNGGAA